MIALGLLALLLLIASVTDIRRHKIYNWNVYPGIVLGLLINAAGAWLVNSADAQRLQRIIGWLPDVDNPLADSAAGFLVCGLAMVICFVFFPVGGGDVKLMAMLGAFLGLEQGIQTMLWTLLLGGALGLIMLIWRMGAITLVATVLKVAFGSLRGRRLASAPPEVRKQFASRMFLAPVAAPAVLIVKYQLLAVF